MAKLIVWRCFEGNMKEKTNMYRLTAAASATDSVFIRQCLDLALQY